MSYLSTVLLVLAGCSLFVMLICFAVAARAAREARATIFPIVREEETLRMWRARAAASVAGVLAATMAGAFFLSQRLLPPVVSLSSAPPGEVSAPATGEVLAAVLPSATPSLTPEPTVAPTQEVSSPTPLPDTPSATPLPPTPTSPAEMATARPLPPTATPIPPSPTATASPTPVPADTPTPSPTATSAVSPISMEATPTPAPAEPIPDDVKFGPITFAAGINDQLEPINPTRVFSETVKRVYAVFPFEGMRRGLNWTQVWYFNGLVFLRDQSAWEWGTAATSYVFTKPRGAGTYRLELYVNDTLVASGSFVIQGPAAIGGPKNP